MSVRNKTIIITLVYLVVLVMIVIFVIIPFVKKIQTISQEVYDEQVHLEQLYMRGQLIKRVRHQLAEINPFIEKMSHNFINSEQGIDFILTLENLAKENNLNQRIEMKPEQAIQKNIYKVQPVQLTLKGNFIDFVRYLKGLEEMSYYFNVDALNIVSSRSKYIGQTPEQGQLNILLQAQSYWLH